MIRIKFDKAMILAKIAKAEMEIRTKAGPRALNAATKNVVKEAKRLFREEIGVRLNAREMNRRVQFRKRARRGSIYTIIALDARKMPLSKLNPRPKGVMSARGPRTGVTAIMGKGKRVFVKDGFLATVSRPQGANYRGVFRRIGRERDKITEMSSTRPREIFESSNFRVELQEYARDQVKAQMRREVARLNFMKRKK
jgi:hypothetical protein